MRPVSIVLLLAACHGRGTDSIVPSTSGGTSSGTPAVPSFRADPEEKGLVVRLYDASPPSDAGDGAPVDPGTPVRGGALDTLLGRLPDLEEEDGDRRTFALRAHTKPPPRTGPDVLETFPPPPRPPPTVAPGKVPKVVRFSPEGEVPMAPNVSVTFDQPMIALTSQEEASKRVPATLTPQPAGRWRWLGTKTLLFDPDPRLPMATEYTLEIPAGTTAASGAALTEAFRFTFSTPAPQLQTWWPNTGLPTDLSPTVLLRFDQRMDPGAVLERLKVTGAGADARFRLATPEEIADAGIPMSVFALDAAEGAVVAVHPVEPLPKASSISLVIPRGTPSAEGPRTTTGDQYASFYTYHPLRIEDHGCWYDEPCPPTSSWYVRFDNPIDPEAFDPTGWRVSPAVPGLSVVPSGDMVTISGAFQGRTAYTVTVPAGVTDTFGQTLGKDQDFVVRVGPAEKTLDGAGGNLVVLDPASGDKMSVWSVNHPRLKVQVHEVQPSDWEAWTKWIERFWYEDAKPGRLPGKVVFDGTIDTKGEADRRTETAIDFSQWTGDDHHGQFVVLVEPTVQPRDRWNRQYVYKWVQVTDLGLVAFADGDEIVGWASDLSTGDARPDVTLSLLGREGQASTGADGLAELSLPGDSLPNQVLVARTGDDLAILPESDGPNYGTSWYRHELLDQLRWYVADDRGLYRPGETARIKGWLRNEDQTPEGDVGPLQDPGDPTISWTLTSSMGHELAKGTAEVSRLGGFHFDVELPPEADLGEAQLMLSASGVREVGTTTYHTLRIEEFRRPEFEVSAAVDEGPHLLGLDARFDLTAAYYAGGGLQNADTTWNVFAEAGHYVPPGMQGWSFGTWTPWWIDAWSWASRSGNPMGEGYLGQLTSTTDPKGEHHLGIHFESMSPPRPYDVRAEATVMDVNRQAWTATARTMVHPSDRYVGLKTERSFVEKGLPIEVDLAVVDLDGHPATGEVTASIVRLDYGSLPSGGWGEIAQDERPCAVTLDADAHAHCSFPTERGGSYRVTARVVDADGRPNESELRVWVSGAETTPSRSVELEQITLVPEQRELHDGEVARVLVQAPFTPAEGTWTLRRNGIEHLERFRMGEPTTTLEIPIDDSLVPNVQLEVHLVGAAQRVDDKGQPLTDVPSRVAHASGTIDFVVPPTKRTLGVEVTAADPALEPGGDTKLRVTVKDPAGAPLAGAELTVVAVDESVLALTGYELPDPIEVFYGSKSPGVADHFLRSWVTLGDPTALVQAPAGTVEHGMLGGARNGLGTRGVGIGGGGIAAKSAPMAELAAAEPMAPPPAQAQQAVTRSAGKKEAERMEDALMGGEMATTPVTLRTEFGALALFAPDVVTGADGTAELDLHLPDSLTRYRVMVVAADPIKSFGSAETTVVARKPLMVRPSAPRFLNFGDQAEIPIVVQNQTDAEMVVDVGIRATNLAFVEQVEPVLPDLGDMGVSSAGRRVKVPANDRVEVRFPAATLGAGTARLQVVAASGKRSDAAELSLPVWTPATTEAFATYGSIESGTTVQPVEAPPAVWTQFGGLEVTTSSTQLQALTDAVLYLESYPFDCNEQIASRVLGIASLRDVLTAFESPALPAPAVLEHRVEQDLRHLADRQHWNGGWSFWRKGDETWPYLSIHVANAFARAKAKGYDVPDHSFRQAASHLQNIESYIPWWYSEESKAFLRAYALDVLRRMGQPDVRKARQLYKERGTLLNIDGLAFLLPTLWEGGAKEEANEILHTLANRVTESAGTAHFVTSYSDGAQVLLHSDRRADGIVLEALMETAPDDELVEKVVRGLLAHKTKGRWENTNESAFVLLSLDRYFRIYEKETPDFVARVWLGDGYAGDHAFRGRTTERSLIEVPMGYLTEHKGLQPLTLQMDGDQGRLYYRLGLRYAPRDLRLDPADYGFAVERRYVPIDDPGDVTRDADGVWHVRAGARLRVELTMVNEMRRYHVALVDPLPGGFEAQNPVLATSGTLPSQRADDQPVWWWWSRTWYEHEQMHDERVEAFTSLLWDGVHDYDYVVRATTPGRFVVPPAKAEEMYMPETFGRTGTDIVVIE
ncbi:MAG: Ig-like domain-containing protein [Alphaproteobacteria bacterium]|nr:Ig-like domain-containing protein [Alphaproteobacteria bacterium]